MAPLLTGRTRYRAGLDGGKPVIVLQVEYSYCSSPVSGWRDALLEDLRGAEIEVRT